MPAWAHSGFFIFDAFELFCRQLKYLGIYLFYVYAYDVSAYLVHMSQLLPAARGRNLISSIALLLLPCYCLASDLSVSVGKINYIWQTFVNFLQVFRHSKQPGFW